MQQRHGGLLRGRGGAPQVVGGGLVGFWRGGSLALSRSTLARQRGVVEQREGIVQALRARRLQVKDVCQIRQVLTSAADMSIMFCLRRICAASTADCSGSSAQHARSLMCSQQDLARIQGSPSCLHPDSHLGCAAAGSGSMVNM